MDYSFYTSTAQPYQFNTFSPAPGQPFESQDDAMVDAQVEPQQQVPKAERDWLSLQQDVYQGTNGFPSYDPTFQFPNNGFLQPSQDPVPQGGIASQTDAPPTNIHRPSIASLPSNEQASGSGTAGQSGENEHTDAQNGSRSDSDEKESMTPQQSRRKAQNRAAQRAFRERKEKHVKELETKLNDLSEHSSTLLSDNERLKKELQRLSTQNEILRATAGQPQPPPRPRSPTHGPQRYSPTGFAMAVGLDQALNTIPFPSYNRPSGEKMVHAGDAWDLIERHELVRRGAVDLAEVAVRLRGRATCDGRGPAFREIDVLQAIEDCAHTGNDELI